MVEGERVVEVDLGGGSSPSVDPVAHLRDELARERQARAAWQQSAAENNHIAAINAQHAIEKDIESQLARVVAAKDNVDTVGEARALAELQTLQLKKLEIDAAARRAESDAQQLRQRQPTVADWIEAQSPENRRWIERHRQRFEADEGFRNRAIAASGYGVTVLGLVPGTSEYYHHIDDAAGVGANRTGDPVSGQPQPATTFARRESSRRPTPSAPPHSGSGSEFVPPGGERRISLSAEEYSHAKWMFGGKGVSDHEAARKYWHHKQALIAEGKLA